MEVNGKLRKEAYEKLKVFLSNQGKFCLLVLGSRGTGKHFAIEKVFSEIKSEDNNLCLKSLSFIAAEVFPDKSEEIDKILKENQCNTVVIEDIEELSAEQQRLLFNALSTTNGKFGISEKFDIRIVFTSSKDINKLRTNEDILLGYFWDRISQLIVELPSYKNEYEYVVKDFYSTWEKMKFENIDTVFAGVPKNMKLQKFLEDNAEKFEGNFRDLDKLACLYFNYRIFHYGDKRKISDEIEKVVVDSVKTDFFSKSQLLNDNNNEFCVFRFEKGKSAKELQYSYEKQLKKWATKEYGTIGKAEIKLGLKNGTMKNYGKPRIKKA